MLHWLLSSHCCEVFIVKHVVTNVIQPTTIHEQYSQTGSFVNTTYYNTMNNKAIRDGRPRPPRHQVGWDMGMCMSNFMMIGWEMAEILHIEISWKHVSVTYDLDTIIPNRVIRWDISYLVRNFRVRQCSWGNDIFNAYCLEQISAHTEK